MQEVRKSYQALDAKAGMLYTIWVPTARLKQEDGSFKTGPGRVKAEFLTQGGKAFSTLSFFRRSGTNGFTVVHGIPNYSMIREEVRVLQDER